VSKHLFRKQEWLSRPSWFWSEVSKDENIQEVADPWSTSKPSWVFCEDVSRFRDKKQAREFVADVPSPFVRRFIADPKTATSKRSERL